MQGQAGGQKTVQMGRRVSKRRLLVSALADLQAQVNVHRSCPNWGHLSQRPGLGYGARAVGSRRPLATHYATLLCPWHTSATPSVMSCTD